MLFKLSLKNIKKCVKDYSIYFFTLVVAVAIFYVFNSMDSQNAMLTMSKVKHDLVEGLITIINYISVFVSIILGFLIIYSNNFLIKRRKKEMGLYLTLGMSKRKVSLILVFETLLVGAVSLAVGLGLGIVLSQGLSVVVAHMFEADLSSYRFVFSSQALIKTLIYFGVIFVLVMIFNVITLSRYKLIDLLYANRKNESVKFRNKYLMIISFILSVVLVGWAYYYLFHDALFMMDYRTVLMLIFGAIGTLLFFFSLSGFALAIVQKIKPLYFKGLNMFNIKQINNKINTSVISTTVICLMLLLTVGILAGSLSLSAAFNGDVNKSNPADFTLFSNYYVYDKVGYTYNKVDFNKIMNQDEFKNYVKEYVTYTTYNLSSLTYRDLLNDDAYNKLIADYGNMVQLDTSIRVIKESEYNNLMKLYGNDTIDLSKDEYLETMNVDISKPYFGEAYKSGQKINVNGMELHPGTTDTVEVQLENSTTASNDCTLIVDDEILDDNFINQEQNLSEKHLVGNYAENDTKENTEEKFKNFVQNNKIEKGLIRTKITMASSSIGVKVIITFIGLYLGIIFALASVTILAIGELSESSDNKERYKVLRQIGADEKMINKALFTQIFITFMLPLAVALFHAFFGLREINSLIKAVGNIDISRSVITTTIFMLVVYGGYFAVTYLCSKRIIKD